MAFTTWAALKTSILNDMADGSVLTKGYGVEGRSRTFQDLGEVQKFLQFCDMQIMAEGGDNSRTSLVEFARPT